MNVDKLKIRYEMKCSKMFSIDSVFDLDVG